MYLCCHCIYISEKQLSLFLLIFGWECWRRLTNDYIFLAFVKNWKLKESCQHCRIWKICVRKFFLSIHLSIFSICRQVKPSKYLILNWASYFQCQTSSLEKYPAKSSQGISSCKFHITKERVHKLLRIMRRPIRLTLCHCCRSLRMCNANIRNMWSGTCENSDVSP